VPFGLTFAAVKVNFPFPEQVSVVGVTEKVKPNRKAGINTIPIIERINFK